MSNSDTRIPRTRTVLKVEEPEHLFRGARKNPWNGGQTGCVGTDAHKRAALQMAEEPERKTYLCVLTDQVASEERPANIMTALVVLVTA